MMWPHRVIDTETTEERLVVTIPTELKRQLDMYMTLCDFEISGLGEVAIEEGRLAITNLHLLEQEGSAGETQLSATTVAQFVAEAAANGISVSNVRLWWHSHARIKAYWSDTDMRTIESFGRAGWWLSIVGNHHLEYHARLDIFPTTSIPLRITKPVLLVPLQDPNEVAAVRAEIEAKVHLAPPQPPIVLRKRGSRRGRAASVSMTPDDWGVIDGDEGVEEGKG